MLRVRRARIPSREATELYEKAFPFHERRSREHHISKAATEPDFYTMEVDTECGEFVGILYYWHWEQHALLFVEHLAIVPHLRGRGYGHKLLRLIELPETCIMLEIEPVTDALTARRLNFYESAGFVRLPYPHVQLPYHCGGEPVVLELLSRQSNGLPATPTQAAILEQMLHTQVMSHIRENSCGGE